MTLEEFDEMNAKASYKVIAFNRKYAKKILHIHRNSLRKVRIIGLQKYLTSDGMKPISKPFVDRASLSVSEIYQASAIIFFVKVETLRADEQVPLNVFLEANEELASMW